MPAFKLERRLILQLGPHKIRFCPAFFIEFVYAAQYSRLIDKPINFPFMMASITLAISEYP